MPVLHSYENKSGFYIRAKPHSTSTPITYQIHSVAEDLFRDAGFSNGDSVPWRFLQPLIAINHIYTYGSGVENTYSITENLASLTDNQQEEVFDYLQSYLQIDDNKIKNFADAIRSSSSQASNDLIEEINREISKSDKGASQSLHNIAKKHFGEKIDEETIEKKPNKKENQESMIEFSGEGGAYSDLFTLSGGFTLIHLQYHDTGRYKVRAVGETAEDHTINLTTDQTPISHKIINEYDSDSYILNIEAPNEGQWTIKVYDKPPSEVSLPLKMTGRGRDVIGPLPTEGFTKVSVSNFHKNAIRLKQARKSGKSYLNDPSMKIEGIDSGEQNIEQQVMSTVDGSTDYPYLQIRADGDWIIEIEGHG